MEYITYKRFKGKGISGNFNFAYGTRLTEKDGYLYAPNGEIVCAATSENGWEHFHPDTEEGSARQKMLSALYRYYEKNDVRDDLSSEYFARQANQYWKSLLRTAETAKLEELFEKRCKRV